MISQSIGKIAVLGGDGSGVIVADAVRASQRLGAQAELVGFLNDVEPAGARISGTPVLGRFEDWRTLDPEVRFIGAIHKPKKARSRLARLDELGISADRWVTVCHPQASFSDDAIIARGCYLGPGACVMPSATVGEHCSLRGCCYVSHDVTLARFAFVGPNATISGKTIVGEGGHVGPNASVREECRLGRWCVVAMGAVVIDDVPDYAIVAGNPARLVARITET